MPPNAEEKKAPTSHNDATASAAESYLIPDAAQDKQNHLELLFYALAQQAQQHQRNLQLIDSKLTTILNVILHKADLESEASL